MKNRGTDNLLQVDAFWHVPHYEKMSYDNAQLCSSLSEAIMICRESRDAANVNYLEEVLKGTLHYVSTNMTHPEGGIYTAEDAESFPSHQSVHKKEGGLLESYPRVIFHLCSFLLFYESFLCVGVRRSEEVDQRETRLPHDMLLSWNKGKWKQVQKKTLNFFLFGTKDFFKKVLLGAILTEN